MKKQRQCLKHRSTIIGNTLPYVLASEPNYKIYYTYLFGNYTLLIVTYVIVNNICYRMYMESWRKELRDFIEDEDITRDECIELIKMNGGKIGQSGFSHWLQRHPKTKPNIKNAYAIEKVTKGRIKFQDIYSDDS